MLFGLYAWGELWLLKPNERQALETDKIRVMVVIAADCKALTNHLTRFKDKIPPGARPYSTVPSKNPIT